MPQTNKSRIVGAWNYGIDTLKGMDAFGTPITVNY